MTGVGFLFSVLVLAGGIGVELPIYTIDLSETLAKAPGAAEGAFTAIEGALADLGMPQAVLDDLAAEFDQALSGIEEALEEFPTLLPMPHLGASIEFSLPFVVIDGLRFSGGVLNDQILRGIGDLSGFDIPQPLLDVEIEEDGFEASFIADFSFSSFILYTDLLKRLDFVIGGIDFGLGLDVILGRISPEVTYQVPQEFEDGTEAALAALYLDQVYWSAFGIHGLVGFELGPPFLRLFAEIRFFLPVSQTSGWWGIGVGSLAGDLGLVIRF
jgi:hypothetical protein